MTRLGMILDYDEHEERHLVRKWLASSWRPDASRRIGSAECLALGVQNLLRRCGTRRRPDDARGDLWRTCGQPTLGAAASRIFAT